MKAANSRETLIHPRCPHCGADASPLWSYCAGCGRSPQASKRTQRAAAALLWFGIAGGLSLVASQRPAAPGHAALCPAGLVSSSFTVSRAGGAADQVTLVLPADHWMTSGVTVRKGDRIEVRASGQWNPWKGVSPELGPSGLAEGGPVIEGNAGKLASSAAERLSDRACMDANWGALVGRIGDGPCFPIGDYRALTADRAGILEIGINDDAISGGSKDNRGSLLVQMKTTGELTRSTDTVTIPKM